MSRCFFENKWDDKMTKGSGLTLPCLCGSNKKRCQKAFQSKTGYIGKKTIMV